MARTSPSKAGNLEWRAAAELRASGRKLVGYAATFDTEARFGGMREVVRAGAFRDTLANGGDVLALVDHNPRQVLGRTRAGTLRLTEDQRGLAFELDVPDTTTGRDVLALAERGDIGGMSFGFNVRPGGETRSGGRRELRALDLMEISVVHAFPAYQGTSVEARGDGPEPPGVARARRLLETYR